MVTKSRNRYAYTYVTFRIFIDIVTKIILYSALAGVALTGFGFWGSKKISENQRVLLDKSLKMKLKAKS